MLPKSRNDPNEIPKLGRGRLNNFFRVRLLYAVHSISDAVFAHERNSARCPKRRVLIKSGMSG